MLKRFIRTLMAAVAVISLLAASSCDIGLHRLEFDREHSVYVDRTTGVEYKVAPGTFESAVDGDKYAKLKIGKNSVIFYKIEGLDPKLWLTEEYGTVFYSADITLPTLREMNPYVAYICVEQEITVALVEITDRGELEEIISDWESGEPEEYRATTPTANYRIKFESEEYPGLYYSLVYLEYSDGSRYLYSRDEGRFVPCGKTISQYIG